MQCKSCSKKGWKHKILKVYRSRMEDQHAGNAKCEVNTMYRVKQLFVELPGFVFFFCSFSWKFPQAKIWALPGHNEGSGTLLYWWQNIFLKMLSVLVTCEHKIPAPHSATAQKQALRVDNKTLTITGMSFSSIKYKDLAEEILQVKLPAVSAVKLVCHFPT